MSITAERRSDAGSVLGPLDGPAVWTAEEMLARQHEWLVPLEADEIAELEAAAASFLASGRELLALDRAAFPLPRLGPRLARWRREILEGRGFVQLRGLPVGRYDRRTAAAIFMGIGKHLGDAFASQNAKGHVLGHIADIGQSRGNPDQRGPYSAEALPYHVDACDIVGLLCLSPARAGGESSLASAGLVHNRLLAERPDLVEALSQPVYRDRRGEIPPGKPPWYATPVFSRHDGLLTTSIEPTYIGSVARHFAAEPNTPAQIEGVATVQALADALRLDIAFEAGDMQFLHNHTVMHSRQAFADGAASGARRHLLRLWLLCHDGRPLPEAFYERHGTRQTVRRPGGIVGPDTELNCPLEPC